MLAKSFTELTPADRAQVAACLRRLATEGRDASTDPTYGICANLRHVADIAAGACVDEIARKWPKAASHEGYPVPCPESMIPRYNNAAIFRHRTGLIYLTSSQWAYHNAQDTDSMWVGEYGDLRKELCEWMADYLEALC